MTIIELVTSLSAIKEVEAAARVAVESSIAGSKDIYLAWGKEKGVAVKQLNEAWKAIETELKPNKPKVGAGGFAAAYYDWLAEEGRSEEEAYAYIMDEDNSANVKAHLTHYLNIWALAETVRQGKRVSRTIGAAKNEDAPARVSAKKEPEWEYDPAHPFACEKSAKKTLSIQMNFVAKKRTIKVLEQGAACEWPVAESFTKLLERTREERKG